MAVDAFTARAPRLSIVRLDTAQTLEAQFNPDELQETCGAMYARQKVPGLSHQVKQFSNTEDLKWKFALQFYAAPLGIDGVHTLANARWFLISCCFPRVANSLGTAGAPRVMLVWPRVITVVGVIPEGGVSWKFTRFNRNGDPVEARAEVTIEQLLDDPLTADDIYDALGSGVGGRS